MTLPINLQSLTDEYESLKKSLTSAFQDVKAMQEGKKSMVSLKDFLKEC